ncbi:MAG: 4-hydroxybenzoate 3-monooxygenase, partial [Micromonosporaceae bacterium]
MSLKTGVAIVGAGPAGLLLGNILIDHGIDCVILERNSRERIESRARAGLIEDSAVQELTKRNLADRLRAEGTPHDSCEFRIGGRRHIAQYGQLAGDRNHYVYPQQELVKDMVAAFLHKGGELYFEAPVTAISKIDSRRPRVRAEVNGKNQLVKCDVIAGCDGFHGVARDSAPKGAATVYEYEHRHGWVAVLASAPPSTQKIIYALHQDGFAGHMLRSSTVSRYYLQCPAGDQVEDWPDDRIWSQLRHRLATDDDWSLQDGPVVEKNILEMRSWVTEPMQFGKLYLAGDAAHILTPAGAKGMNLALGDARELALGLVEHYHKAD